MNQQTFKWKARGMLNRAVKKKLGRKQPSHRNIEQALREIIRENGRFAEEARGLLNIGTESQKRDFYADVSRAARGLRTQAEAAKQHYDDKRRKGLKSVVVYVPPGDVEKIKEFEAQAQAAANASVDDDRRTANGATKQKRVVIPNTPEAEAAIVTYAKKLREDAGVARS